MIVRRMWGGERPHPRAEFERVRREMEELMSVVQQASEDDDFAGVYPAMNITQDADNFYARAELPGIKASELELSTIGKQLTLSGQRKISTDRPGASYHRRERGEGSFSRTVTLPTDVQSEQVSARYLDGILTVTLPKAEEAKPRQISVQIS